MEQLFGSDEALGVWFLSDNDDVLSLADYAALHQAMGDAMPGGQSLFPDGSSAVCCTEYAVQIYRKLTGRVQIFGFANEDNPTSRVAREQIHPGGHDFAVVDGQFLVDPWIRLVVNQSEQIVFDLAGARDAPIVADWYGPATCWRRMTEAEHYADKPVVVPRLRMK
jgi:hypothetical protein